jgi:hypothetical protein
VTTSLESQDIRENTTYARKTYGVIEVKRPSFLNSAIDKVEL